MLEAAKKLLGHPLLASLTAMFLPPRTLVLTYHDLREDGDFTSWMRVTCSTFASQLHGMAKLGMFIRPDQLASPLDPGNRRLRFLITFDDGYVNNFRLALPILEDLGIPALFFVSTFNMLREEPFWFDRVVIPIQHLRINDIDLSQFGLKRYSFEGKDGSWRWEHIQRMLVDIKKLGNPSDPPVRGILDHLEQMIQPLAKPVLENYRPLSPEEIQKMARSELCFFGSHSHHHEILTYLNDEELEFNLRESKKVLEDLVGAQVIHIAYPNGDCDLRVQRACAQAGYHFGFTTRPGLIGDLADPFAVPRIQIGGYDSVALVRFRLNRLLLAEAARRVGFKRGNS